jgi:tetratricopeptide (TPR) repeat protein
MYQEARDVLEQVVREYPTLPDIVELEFEIAETYIGQEDSSAATRKLTALITDYPDSDLIPEVKLALGTALESERRYDKASALYQQLLTSFPTGRIGAEAQERLGDIAFNQAKYAEAVALYTKRVEMAVAVTDNDRVLLKLARAYGAMGKWDESATTCRNLLELFKKSELEPEAIVQLCRAEEKRGLVEAAIQYAYEGHMEFPENPEIAKSLADLHFLKQDYSEAARLYDESVKVGPDDPEAWFRGGEAHFNAGDLESSYKDFREVTRRFPSDALAYDAYLKLADVLYMRGDPQRALDLLSSRLPEHIVSARREPILSKMAGLYLDVGLPGQAAETYAAMLDGVDDDEIQARMGIASLQAERWEKGLRAVRSVDRSRVPPELAYAMFLEMGVALRGFGDLRGAMQALETSVNGYPAYRDARGVTALLRTYLAANKVAEARKLASEIENWASGREERAAVSAQAALVWGDFLFSRGDYLNALEGFTKIAADERVPNSIKEWASYQKSNTYFQLARYDESLAAYQDFLQKYPSSSWKNAAQTRLEVAKLEMRLRRREF